MDMFIWLTISMGSHTPPRKLAMLLDRSDAILGSQKADMWVTRGQLYFHPKSFTQFLYRVYICC